MDVMFVAAQQKGYDACTPAIAPAAAHVNHRPTLPVGAHDGAAHTCGVCFEPRQAAAAPAPAALSAAVPAMRLKEPDVLDAASGEVVTTGVTFEFDGVHNLDREGEFVSLSMVFEHT